MKLGSLFDGSGGFPLAGVLCGIEPVWASEVEAYPIRVTTARFPGMKHLGDVRNVNGAEVEPVDVITFGSPCQDLSVAGKQAGIHDGKRSNLFFEAIRIIKEMRNGTADEFPRFAVWENVPGAFSSNKGEDFRAVLEAFGSVCGGEVSVPRPPKGKWLPAGCIVGDGWSVAWRVYDAQFWGVPQRRKRIYLIADFGSERAGEILFEQESGGRDTAAGGKAGKGTACDAEGRTGRGCGTWCLKGNWIDRDIRQNGRGWCGDVAYTLDATDRHGVAYEDRQVASFLGGLGEKAKSIAYHDDGVSPTLRGAAKGGGTVPSVCYGISRSCLKGGEGSNGGMPVEKELSPGLVAQGTGAVCYDARGNGDGKVTTGVIGDHERRVTDYTTVCVSTVARALGMDRYTIDGTFGTLKHRDWHGGAVDIVCMGNGQNNQSFGDKAGALNCMHDQQAVITGGDGKRKYIVRRLTPLECCRLQGFPDWWCDGVEGSDTAQYKMWGNGLSLPCAHDVMRRIAKALTKRE